jgi:hypothetical protein
VKLAGYQNLSHRLSCVHSFPPVLRRNCGSADLIRRRFCQ